MSEHGFWHKIVRVGRISRIGVSDLREACQHRHGKRERREERQDVFVVADVRTGPQHEHHIEDGT